MTGRWGAAIAVATALASALPAAAPAEVTIGSDLSGTPTLDSGRGTWADVMLDRAERAAGGVRSPVNGSITAWRIKVGGRTAPVALRVIRRLGGGLFIGAGTSATEMPAPNTTNTFPASLHVSIGDLIGTQLAHSEGGSLTQFTNDGSPSTRLFSWFMPDLCDGGPGTSPSIDAGSFVSLVDADVEPTSKFKIDRAVQLDGGRLRIKLTLPNPGTLRVDVNGERIGGAKVAAAGRKILVVRPRGPGSRLKLRIGFTPIYGTAAKRFSEVVRP